LRGDLAHRAAQLSQEEGEKQEVIALLGLRLTPCQWSILCLLLVHPFLSNEELAAYLSLQQKSVRCSLYELHQLRCLEPIPTEAGKRWHLCKRGLRLIAAANHMHMRNIAALSDDGAESETSTVVQRGEAWLLQRIKHTAGIYGFFARLALAARQESEHALCWWETGPVCERCYRLNEQWYNLRPDALAEYRVGPSGCGSGWSGIAAP
jgi:Replication-relaxation